MIFPYYHWNREGGGRGTKHDVSDPNIKYLFLPNFNVCIEYNWILIQSEDERAQVLWRILIIFNMAEGSLDPPLQIWKCIMLAIFGEDSNNIYSATKILSYMIFKIILDLRFKNQQNSKRVWQ